jgi:hypothetical protein
MTNLTLFMALKLEILKFIKTRNEKVYPQWVRKPQGEWWKVSQPDCSIRAACCHTSGY